jgi:hypothetical protein
MGAKPHQYNALDAKEKDEFNKEAQRLIAELQSNDMEAYNELTNAPDEVNDDRPITSKRRFF